MEYQKIIATAAVCIFGLLSTIAAIVLIYHLYLGFVTNEWWRYKDAFISSSFIFVVGGAGVFVIRIIQRFIFGSQDNY